jgi:hypothetical protein
VTCAVCETELPADALFCGECGSSAGLAAQSGADAAPESNTTAVALTFDAKAELPSESVAASDGGETGEAFDEFTRIQAPKAPGHSERYVLQFSTGESVQVSGTGLIGRNPAAQPGEFFDALVTIVDHERSVSKTHLEFGEEEGQFWVADRFSANGTIVRDPERIARRSEPGKRTRVSRGARVEIGEQFFIVS